MFQKFFTNKHKRIYLDYAAATPLRTEVLQAMRLYFSEHFANPSAVHQEGVRAREAIETARKEIAAALRVRKDDVIFTASGTESNNLALYGMVRFLTEEGKVPLREVEIISTKIEHPSILRVLEHLEATGVTIRYARVGEDGRINQKEFESLLTSKTALVTYAYVNSEIGTVQEVKRLSRAVRKFNTENNASVKIHLDASQAPLWLPCSLDMLGVDLLTLDAGKCYGPKGVGVLAHRHGIELKGVVLGGDQELGLRGGTENTPLIVGAAKAFLLAQGSWRTRSEKTKMLRDFMIERVRKEIEGAVLNGGVEHRVANNVNVSIPGIDSEFAVISLDRDGISASTQSACSGFHSGGSEVIRTVTDSEERAYSSIRFTLGEDTTEEQLKRVIDSLKEHVRKVRNFERKLTID